MKDKILGVVGTFKSRQHHLDIGVRDIEVKLCIVVLLSRQLKEHPTYKKSARDRSVVSKLIEAAQVSYGIQISSKEIVPFRRCKDVYDVIDCVY